MKLIIRSAALGHRIQNGIIWKKGRAGKFHSVINSAIDNEGILAAQDMKWFFQQDMAVCKPSHWDFLHAPSH